MQASIDQNNVKTILGTSNTDGFTPIRITADPTTHALHVGDGDTGSDLSGDVDYRDENFRPDLLAVSNTDGVTPTVVYSESSDGALLINSD